ncbi:MAG: SH3 domain-containing protein [Desulfovibrionaceae bacterium]|nr:SH3 domain-containing protein [Desulfovibrionaceae bacterium]
MALRPSDPAWASGLGALLARRGKDALAVTAFEQVAAMSPGDTLAKTSLAAVLAAQAWKAAAQGRAGDAVALCRGALRADPGQAGCLYLARRGGAPVKPEGRRDSAPAGFTSTAPEPSQPNEPQPAKPAQSGQPGATQAVVSGSLAKLRAGPGADQAVVRVLPPGQRLTVVGRQGDWIEALTPGGSRGFVRADLIRAAEPGQ